MASSSTRRDPAGGTRLAGGEVVRDRAWDRWHGMWLAIYGMEELAVQGNGRLGTATNTRRSEESPRRRRREVGDAPDSGVPSVGDVRKRGRAVNEGERA